MLFAKEVREALLGWDTAFAQSEATRPPIKNSLLRRMHVLIHWNWPRRQTFCHVIVALDKNVRTYALLPPCGSSFNDADRDVAMECLRGHLTS